MRTFWWVLLALFAMGLVIQLWPLLVLGGLVWLIVWLVKQHGQHKAAQATAANGEEIKTHRAALAYWQTQVRESELGSAARRTAEDLIEYNKQCLRDLGGLS
jgi:hypothetical protein